MDQSSEHIPADRHIYTKVPIHGLDFHGRQAPLPKAGPAKHPAKVVHAYTLHARSNDRLKDSVAALAVDAGGNTALSE